MAFFNFEPDTLLWVQLLLAQQCWRLALGHGLVHHFNPNQDPHKKAWEIAARIIEKNSLLKSRVVLQMSTDGLAHHGVLAHEHMGRSTQTHADLLHLLGAHVVGSHNEAFWIIIQKRLKANNLGL
jgi:hypothetical protein